MRIVCVAYMQAAGGAERQILMLANHLAAVHEVYLAVLAKNIIKYDVDERVHIIDLSVYETNQRIKALVRFKELKRLYKRIKPDLTIHFWLQSAFLTLLMDKKTRGKVVYSERGDPRDKEYSGFGRIIQKITFSKSNGIVFQTKCAQALFDDKIFDKSVVIHNAVSVPTDLYNVPCRKRCFRIVTAGRLHPQKNQKLLIDAFSIIAKNYPDLTLEIYGDGPLYGFLKEEIAKKGLEGRAFIYPSSSDIFDIIYMSTLFVLCSDYEGLPNVLLEALSLGVPCISTDCRPGGAKELIANGINGLIVPIGDSKELARAIKNVLDNEGLKESLINNSGLIKKNHSASVIYAQWENYLERIIKEKNEKSTNNRPRFLSK